MLWVEIQKQAKDCIILEKAEPIIQFYTELSPLRLRFINTWKSQSCVCFTLLWLSYMCCKYCIIDIRGKICPSFWYTYLETIGTEVIVLHACQTPLWFGPVSLQCSHVIACIFTQDCMFFCYYYCCFFFRKTIRNYSWCSLFVTFIQCCFVYIKFIQNINFLRDIFTSGAHFTSLSIVSGCNFPYSMYTIVLIHPVFI